MNQKQFSKLKSNNIVVLTTTIHEPNAISEPSSVPEGKRGMVLYDDVNNNNTRYVDFGNAHGRWQVRADQIEKVR